MLAPSLGLLYSRFWGSCLLLTHLVWLHIALQEFQAVALTPHKMACRFIQYDGFPHLDSSTAEAYLCYQGGTASLYLSRLACHIIVSGQPAWHYSYFSTHTYPSQCGS